jgi:hypothetical protein
MVHHCVMHGVVSEPFLTQRFRNHILTLSGSSVTCTTRASFLFPRMYPCYNGTATERTRIAKQEQDNMTYHYQSGVRLDTADARRPKLVVAVSPDQTEAIREALAKLASSTTPGVSAQTVILDALRTAAEQTYFWTPEWQAKESAADLAIAEGRLETFDRMDDMIDFLDQQ